MCATACPSQCTYLACAVVPKLDEGVLHCPCHEGYFVLQLWLLTATLNAYLGGDDAAVWPALGASVACLALNLGLLRYLFKR